MPELRDLMDDLREDLGVEYNPWNPTASKFEEALAIAARGYGGRIWPEWKPEEVGPYKPTPEKKERIGFIEKIKRADIRRLAPFAPFGAMESYVLMRAAKRQMDNDYEPGDYRVTSDRNLLVAKFNEIVEERDRKLSIGGWAANIVPNLPGFMAEFIVTGGLLGKLGMTAVSKAGARAVLKQIATKGARKAGLQAAAKATLKTMATAGVREVLMPHRVSEAAFQRLTPEFGKTPEGRFFVREARDKPFTAIVKALGDVYVEMLTEEAGAAIGAGLSAVGGKVIGKTKGTAIAKLLKNTKTAKVIRNSLNKIRKSWMARTGGTVEAFYREAAEKGRFHGLVEEYGEERLGGVLQGVFDLSGEGNVFQRIWQNMPGIRQSIAELGSFGVIPAGGVAAGLIGRAAAGPAPLGLAEPETLQRGIYEPPPGGAPLEIPEAPAEAVAEPLPPEEPPPVVEEAPPRKPLAEYAPELPAPTVEAEAEEDVLPEDFPPDSLAWPTDMVEWAEKEFGEDAASNLRAIADYATENPEEFGSGYPERVNEAARLIAEEEGAALDIPPPTAPGAAAGAAVAAVEAPPAEAPAVEAPPMAVVKVEPPTPLPPIAEIKKTFDNLLRVVAPAVRGPEALETRRIIRYRAAELAQADEATQTQLKTIRKAIQSLPEEERWAFVDDIEAGRLPRLPRLRQAAIDLRKLMESWRAEIQALGKGKLEKYYENYFPHIWQDPVEAEKVIAQILGKRPLRGTAAFLKKRTIMTIREGMERGLTPITDNPIDLILLKAHEIKRYIMGEKIMSDLKEKGLAQFVLSGRKAPEGYRRIDDRVATVYAPPEMTMKEAYDQKMVEDLTRIATRLGIKLQRRVNVGGKRWGFADGNWNVTTKFAGPESILAHEIGHIIGKSYDLFNWLTGKGQWHAKEIRQELRDLTDLKYEGLAPTPGFKRYVRKAAEKEAVLLEALIHAPERFKEIAPDTYKQFTKFLAEHAELRELLDVKPSLVLGSAEAKVRIPGISILGNYWATEPVATLLNNFTSAGLRGNILYDVLRRAGNVMNQAQLALSGFHAGNTTLDVIGTELGLALREIFATKGMQLQGLKRITTLPVSAVVNLWRGGQLIKEMRKDLADVDPHLRNMVEAVMRAGGRTRLDSFYYNQAWRSLTDTWRDLRNGSLYKKTTAPIWIPWRAAAAALEATAKPLMMWLVPRQKLGAFYNLAKHEMDRLNNEDVSDPVVWERLTQVWDNVDNRMGQLVYDNLFWNKTFKDVLMLSQRSVGWNLGSWREFGGAALDVFTTPKRLAEGDTWLSQKQAYVIGVMSVYMVTGAVLGYLMTGKWPDEWRDYFFIKTGKTNPDGTPERVSLPAYAKDIFAYAKHPISTLEHKLHPLWAMVMDMLHNRDFFGVEIRHSDDSVVKQLGDVAAYGAKQFIPFSVQNYMKRREAGATKWQAAAAYAGIIKTPASMTRTPAFELMIKHIVAKLPRGAKTREKHEARQERKKFIEQLRRGLPVDVAAAIEKYTSAELKKMAKAAETSRGTNMFKGLTIEEACDVFAIADTAEKKEWAEILATKMDNYSDEKPDYAEVSALYDEVTK